jgi:cytosine deaminase
VSWPLLTHEAVLERALRYCDLAVSQGLLAIRSHVDVCDDRLVAVDALLEVKRKVAPYLHLELVAFPQDGYFRSPTAAANLERALDRGVEVVGGIPHFERTMADGAASVRALCEIAAARGLRVDLHCDETDDPLSRHIETLVCEAQRLGLNGRVAGSHLTSMHSMDNYYVSKLLPLMAEAGVAAIPNPLINIVLQVRHDTYPKRRGMTRVPGCAAPAFRVAFGQDCCIRGIRLGRQTCWTWRIWPCTSDNHVARSNALLFRCDHGEPARIMGLSTTVSMSAATPTSWCCRPGSIEAIRLRATRLFGPARRGHC